MHPRHSVTVVLGDLSPRNAIVVSVDKSAVLRLLSCGGPSAVLWAVATIVIDSVDGQMVFVPIAKRPFFERVEVTPLPANRNSPATPFGITRVIWRASGAHVYPNRINPSPTCSMCSRLVTKAIYGSAAAAGGFAEAKIGPQNRSLRPAYATAKPKSPASRRVPELAQNRPRSKYAACHVDESFIFHPSIIHGRGDTRQI